MSRFDDNSSVWLIGGCVALAVVLIGSFMMSRLVGADFASTLRGVAWFAVFGGVALALGQWVSLNVYTRLSLLSACLWPGAWFILDSIGRGGRAESDISTFSLRLHSTPPFYADWVFQWGILSLLIIATVVFWVNDDHFRYRG